MTATVKTIGAVLLAALLSLALFYSPIGLSQAQEEEDADGTEETEQNDETPGRPGPLTEEEREELRAEAEARRQEFIDDVASELGVTSEELEDAFKTVAIDRVNERADAGDITQEQAEAIIERIEESDGLPFLHGPRHHHPGPRGFGGGFDGPPAGDGEGI